MYKLVVLIFRTFGTGVVGGNFARAYCQVRICADLQLVRMGRIAEMMSEVLHVKT
jgi:hypothetical protein